MAQVADINGRNYKTVVLNKRIFMAENLNVDKFRNGDPIPEAKTTEEWLSANKNKLPAWCYYNNNPKVGEKYGKLYNFYAIEDSRGLAPIGWHILGKNDWGYLLSVDDVSKLKNTNGWEINGNNSLGFSFLPGGLRCGNGIFMLNGINGFLWSSEEEYSKTGGAYYILNSYKQFFSFGITRGEGFSVRCIKD